MHTLCDTAFPRTWLPPAAPLLLQGPPHGLPLPDSEAREHWPLSEGPAFAPGASYWQSSLPLSPEMQLCACRVAPLLQVLVPGPSSFPSSVCPLCPHWARQGCISEQPKPRNLSQSPHLCSLFLPIWPPVNPISPLHQHPTKAFRNLLTLVSHLSFTKLCFSGAGSVLTTLWITLI